jgi:hypothetical protein
MASASGPASATVIPRKPTTSRPAIVRRRSAAGLADALGLAGSDADGDSGNGAVGRPVAGATLGIGERSFVDGRQAATTAAPAARAAPRNRLRLRNGCGLASGITQG